MLWDDYLNTIWRDWKGKLGEKDRLDEPQWLKQWLAEHRFPDLPYPDARELAELKQFRSLLLRIVRTLINGEKIGSEDLIAFNAVLAEGLITRQLGRDAEEWKLEYVPLQSNWKQVMADIAADFAAKMADGEPGRLRICDNPDCLWVYYDETRNRSKRYCDDKLCGNLMKVRRHRARKKAEEQR